MRVNRGTPPGTLHAKIGVHVIFMCARQANLHIQRVHIKLFSHQRREACRHALPHLGAGGVKTNRVVGQHLQKRIGGPTTLGASHRQRCRRARATCHGKTDNEPTASDGTGLQKATTRDIDRVHALPSVCAMAS